MKSQKNKYGIWDGIVVSTIEGRNEARSGPSHLHEVGENGMKQRNGRESTYTFWLRTAYLRREARKPRLCGTRTVPIKLNKYFKETGKRQKIS